MFPVSVTEIKDYAFSCCYSLKSITIPGSVTRIDQGAFNGGMCADVYTTKGCPADLYFRSLDNGSSYIFTMHYPCEQLGHKFGDWTITKDATCTEAGSKERECTRCYEIETEVIPALGHTWAKDYTVDKEPTQTEAGSEAIHCTVCDAIDKTSVRVIPKLGFSVDAEFVLEKPAFNYTGKPIEPSVTVTYNGKQLVRDKDYKVTYGNNIDLGQADVDVTGIGKYIFTTSALEVTDKEVRYKGGTKYVYKVVATEKQFGDSEFFKTATCYRLMPVGIKSLTNPSAGKMTVTYDKSAGCYGYVVRYGLKADMSDARVITVQGQNTTSRTFGGMKKGKTYFVQVRTYKLDNGVRYYSGYCTTKMITIKK